MKIDSLCLVEAFAGEGGAVAVADLHPVPVVEIYIYIYNKLIF